MTSTVLANQEHLENLRQGADAWGRWREENAKVQPNLSEAVGLTQAQIDSARVCQNTKLPEGVVRPAHWEKKAASLRWLARFIRAVARRPRYHDGREGGRPGHGSDGAGAANRLREQVNRMNPDHLRILKQGVDAWNRWRGENPEVHTDQFRADLREANLRGAISLTEDQLDSTEGDADTRLPMGIQRPAHWGPKPENHT